MRIDMVAAAWEAEPAEHVAHIEDLSAALSRQGHEVTLHVRRHAPGLPESEPTRRGYDLVRVPVGPPTRLPKAALIPHLDEFAAYLDRDWAKHAPDVIHLHSWHSGLAVRDSPAPLVQSFHGIRVVEHRIDRMVVRGRTDLERLVALGADRVIAASSDEVFGLVRIGVPGARMSVVPWGVDTDRFRPDGPVAHRGAERRVVALGSALPYNGLRTAITAMAAVPGAELLITGPARPAAPDEECGLLEHARRIGVADRVRFTGEVHPDDLPALLRSADIVVCVPWHEPCGVAVVQAMACGVPVIATAVGAMTDVIIDGVTGVLVPPRDAVALRRALRELLEDPIKRDVCAINGTDRARARYSWNRIATEVANAYRKTTRTRRRGATAEK
ncbi:glycosyltransferase [Umezawaea endophytica]|uniref:Glycosyltransferase n=2 Tax=Umezawaea endophytica TaxID=1654476 RepID=A0A9X2VM00_9PSEU|nr:glycosyltransferase [Umezawaea endophytica]MCS7478462.1 glycosyltransferase [Umezawaea endophytica]